MNDYILSIPLALSQKLVAFIEENGIDFTEIAEQFELLVTEAYYEAEEEDIIEGDLEDHVSVCVEGTTLDSDNR